MKSYGEGRVSHAIESISLFSTAFSYPWYTLIRLFTNSHLDNRFLNQDIYLPLREKMPNIALSREELNKITSYTMVYRDDYNKNKLKGIDKALSHGVPYNQIKYILLKGKRMRDKEFNKLVDKFIKQMASVVYNDTNKDITLNLDKTFTREEALQTPGMTNRIIELPPVEQAVALVKSQLHYLFGKSRVEAIGGKIHIYGPSTLKRFYHYMQHITEENKDYNVILQKNKDNHKFRPKETSIVFIFGVIPLPSLAFNKGIDWTIYPFVKKGSRYVRTTVVVELVFHANDSGGDLFSYHSIPDKNKRNRKGFELVESDNLDYYIDDNIK